MKTRVAIVVSHPIQHFAPLYRKLATQPELQLRVFFCSRIGLDSYFDPGFGVEFKWETNLLEGYESEFLDRAEGIKSTGFWNLRSGDLGRKLKSFQPDVIQVYGYGYLVALQALLWGALHRVPALLMSDSELLHARPLPVRMVKRVLLPQLYRGVSGFLTSGDNNEAYLRHYGVDEAHLFRSPFPTNDELFLATRANIREVRAAARQKLQIDEAAFVAVFVGKLIERKRPADLLAAVRLAAAKTGQPFVALFAGDGALRAALESSLTPAEKGCARFAGFVNQNELPSMYAAADVVAHPSHNDPHPLAVTEGVLMGLPAVVSDKIGSVGPTDTVRMFENGFVFPTGHVPAFAAALIELAVDPSLRQRMGAASRRIAAETGLEACVKGYLEAVRAAVREPPSQQASSARPTGHLVEGE